VNIETALFLQSVYIDDLKPSLQRIEAEMEEIWETIDQTDGALGDEGVAEALIDVENSLQLAIARLKKRGYE